MIMATAVPAAEATPQTAKPRKRKRLFMWTFLAIQAIFVGLIVLYATESTGPSHAEVLQGCAKGAWQGLFKSYHDCMVHYAAGLNGAGHAGQAIGIGLVIFLWVAADVILGVGRLVVLSSRRRRTATA
jgi:hypothetical protein